MTGSQNAPTIAEQAIAKWDEQLARIPDSGAWAQEQLERSVAAGMVAHGKSVVQLARANLVDEATIRNDQQVLDCVGAALQAAADRALGDPELGRRCFGDWVEGPLRRYFELPCEYGSRIVYGRFDGASRPDGMAVLEFNGGLAGGVLGSDGPAQLMRSWPPYAALAEEYDLSCENLGEAAVAALVSTWHAFGGSGLPHIVLAVPAEMREYTATQVRYIIGLCTAAGITCHAADPGQLIRSGGRLVLDGEPVDLVFRVFFTTMLEQLAPRIEALVAAVAAGEVALVTSFRAGLYGHKSLFALVTDPRVELELPGAQAEIARAHLPWTRLVGTAATTAPDGSGIDLRDYALAARDRLVLKPADGTGGAGVLLGWEASEPQWRAALEGAAGSGHTWVLQDRVELTWGSFPWLAAGFPRSDCIVDHNPVVIDDRIRGYFCRISPGGGVTNLTAGGASLVPTFIVSPRADAAGQPPSQ